MECINCKVEYNSSFCPDCGEKLDVPKITFTSMLNAGFSTLTNMDKGFLFNFKNLLLNPKSIIEEYLNGRRKSILNPISYLIITVTIFLIIDSFFDSQVNNFNIKSKAYSFGMGAGQFIKHYFKYFWVLSVTWLSFSTKLVFGKYNLAEHFVINSFIIGQVTLIGMLGYVFGKIGLLFNPIVFIGIIWMLYKFYKGKRKGYELMMEVFAACLLFFIQMITIVGGIGYIIYIT